MNSNIARFYIDNLAESANICSEICLKKDKPAAEKEIACLGTIGH